MTTSRRLIRRVSDGKYRAPGRAHLETAWTDNPSEAVDFSSNKMSVRELKRKWIKYHFTEIKVVIRRTRS